MLYANFGRILANDCNFYDKFGLILANNCNFYAKFGLILANNWNFYANFGQILANNWNINSFNITGQIKYTHMIHHTLKTTSPENELRTRLCECAALKQNYKCRKESVSSMYHTNMFLNKLYYYTVPTKPDLCIFCLTATTSLLKQS